MTEIKQPTDREEIAEKLFMISSEISMFMLFLRRLGGKNDVGRSIELQKRIIRLKKFEEEYDCYLDVKYWNDPQNVRDIRELIETGSANSVSQAIQKLNL